MEYLGNILFTCWEYEEINDLRNKIKSYLSSSSFKWSRGDKVLLPALSGVVKTIVLTVQRYKLIMKVPNFYGIICNIHEMYNACRACITAGPTYIITNLITNL